MIIKHALIHNFEPSNHPCFDDEGDERIGSYYQFIGEDDIPLTDLIGPYRDKRAAEKAAQRAYHRRDF